MNRTEQTVFMLFGSTLLVELKYTTSLALCSIPLNFQITPNVEQNTCFIRSKLFIKCYL